MDHDASRSAKPYRRLAAINRAITMSLDFEEVLGLIVEHAAELFRAPICLVLLTDNAGNLRVRGAHGVDRAALRDIAEPMNEPSLQRLRDALGLEPEIALTTVPILDVEALDGLLILGRRGPVQGEEAWMLSALADQAAIALRNARLHEVQGQARWRESALLVSVSRRLSQLLGIAEISALVCWAARELAGAEAASLALREGDELVFVEEDSAEPLLKGRRMPLARCAAGWSIRARRVAVIEDARTDPRIPDRLFDGTFVRSLASVPVRPEDPIGAVSVYWAAPHTPTSRELELLVALADATSIGLVNADLYARAREARREAEQRASDLLRLQEASVGLTEAFDASLYDRVIERICRVAGAPRGAFWWCSEEDAGPPLLTPIGQYGLTRPASAEEAEQEGAFFSACSVKAERPVARAAREMDLVAAPRTGPGAWGAGLDGFLDRHGIASTLAVPLRARGRLLGVVSLYWEEHDAAEDPAVRHIAEVIANQIAGVLHISELVQQLSRANQLKDEFIATLSHELRNPLNVIVGYADLLSRSPEASRSPLLSEAAGVILRNALAQQRLVSDLLDLSRLQTNKLQLNREKIELRAVLSDSVEGVRGEARERQIALTAALGRMPLHVDADPVRVQQIAWNLLSNALKFTPAGGTVTVTLDRDDGWAILRVIDDGQGIPREFLPVMFEMFRQADASRVRRQQGLGVGLALTRQLVEIQGGRIEAGSEGPGRGAVFTVRLPLAASSDERADGGSPTPAASVGAGGSLRALRVLVVDDSTDTLQILRRLLDIEGAAVRTADNGPDALDCLAREDFDLILCDVSMPGMDGYEVLRRVRAGTRNAGVPALALTGFGQKEDVRLSLAAGFDRHLTKPVRIEQVAVAVRDLRAGGGFGDRDSGPAAAGERGGGWNAAGRRPLREG